MLGTAANQVMLSLVKCNTVTGLAVNLSAQKTLSLNQGPV